MAGSAGAAAKAPKLSSWWAALSPPPVVVSGSSWIRSASSSGTAARLAAAEVGARPCTLLHGAVGLSAAGREKGSGHDIDEGCLGGAGSCALVHLLAMPPHQPKRKHQHPPGAS